MPVRGAYSARGRQPVVSFRRRLDPGIPGESGGIGAGEAVFPWWWAIRMWPLPRGATGKTGSMPHPAIFSTIWSRAPASRAGPFCWASRAGVFLKRPAIATARSLQSGVLMVGDTLYTDVLGGAAMGFSTLLLESGIYKSVGVESAVAEAGIVPDFVAPHL